MTTFRNRLSIFAAAALASALLPTVAAVAATDPAVDAQQLVYELNRARWNPGAFAAEMGSSMPAIPAAPPVAPNPALTSSAMFKANEIADNGYFSHQSAVTGIWPNRLVRDHGYPLPPGWPDDANYLESLHGGSPNPRNVLLSFADSPSHRVHVFGEGGFLAHNEIGVGRSTNQNYWAVHLTPRAGSPLFVTGVVFADTNGNGLMDLGEAMPGVTIATTAGTTTTNAGGGYSISLAPGSYAITASGGGMAASVGASFDLGSYNVGVDFIKGAPRGVVRAYELCQGLQPTILGTDWDDVLVGTSGNDVIHGLGGDDQIDGMGGNDVICGGDGNDVVEGVAENPRLAGGDRYDTAAVVARYSHPDVTGGVVYLATGTNYPDAIAAGPAAARQNAPILLASPTGLPGDTQRELTRLRPAQVVVLGGSTAVSDATLDQVRNLLPGAQVTRRAGSNRYATAVEVSKAAFPSGAGTVFVATGTAFPDALAAAPAAIAAAAPLLLLPATGVPSVVADELRRLAPTRIVVVGDASVVSDVTLDQLGGLAPTVTRLAGATRYATAAQVSRATYPDGADTVYIATGENFPDALAAGPATRIGDGPLLFVSSTSVPDVIRDEIARLAPTTIIVLGGPAVVSDAVAAQLGR